MTSKLNINWLNKCRCGNRMHTVETVRGSHVRLFEDDAVKCNACGREGVIQTCDAIATVLWETDEERAEGMTMTKSTITDKRVTSVIERLEHYACNLKWTNVRGAQDLLTAADGLRELQERRKPLQDKDLQGVIDALEHPAGINAAGKQVVRHALVELQERRKADSEPVALQPELAKVIYHFRDWNEGFPVERFKADYVISWMLANYPPAQPAKDREQVRSEHAEWSQATFGNVGPVGPLKHLSKEALEAAVEPGDLSEWADMQFLMWDAQRRAGITDAQITQAMIEKLAVNKQRKWPEPKDGEPRLHIKEQPRKKVDRCDVCTEGARGGCGTCIFNGNFE